MKITAKLASLLILFTASISSHATFDNAIEHYEEGAYKQAFMWFRSLAEIGHKGAQFNLGVMYLEGTGVETDPVKAYAWIKLSDKKEKKERAFLNEIRQKLNAEQQKEADFFFNSLDKSFSEEALKLALEPVYKPVDTSLDTENEAKPLKTIAPDYPYEAAMKGVEGWAKFAFKLDQEGTPTDIQVMDSYPGDVFVKDSIAAISKWQFETPSDKNQFNKVYKYRLSFELDKNNRKNRSIISEVKEKAEEGDPIAQYYYAKYAPMVERDPEFNTTLWLYKSAQQGIADAQYELAERLLAGQGCEKDKEKAISWLIQSASGNLGRSQFKLAKLFFKVDDKEKAYFWLDKAIESNDSEIALELAEYLYELKDSKYSLDLIIDQLNEADLERVAYPVKHHEFAANLYFLNGQFELAVESQEQAHKVMRKIKRVPDYMQKKLARYEEALATPSS
ncbi:TonB family protein [Kangiella koreensis]|uniref:TonB family protein n=1 Tax=Kangiella koreensis (strain DSM 16069 / JCM 12317 / KCTC 12182 / SW-125) TaxID=523791 RepID=C7RB41_KANKD|nr:TonB family protein [Kangiella koreensis]ACV26483.1 TonB family protein [Kangiella koreensis DSM 16069]